MLWYDLYHNKILLDYGYILVKKKLLKYFNIGLKQWNGYTWPILKFLGTIEIKIIIINR